MTDGEPSQVEERELTYTDERPPHLGGAAPLRHMNDAATKSDGAGEAVGA